RNLPVEFPAGELAGGLAADMDGERRRAGVEELLGVIVGKDDPQIGFQRTQLSAHFGRDLAHVRDDRLVLGLRHGEELGRMGQRAGPSIPKIFFFARSVTRNSTSRNFRSRATCAPSRRGRRPMSASPPSCRGCSAIPASTFAPTPASARPPSYAASASACRNI